LIEKNKNLDEIKQKKKKNLKKYIFAHMLNKKNNVNNKKEIETNF
jgi:hypothetical protein